MQGNEAQSSQIQSSEKDPYEDPQYQSASENPNDYPFNKPISNISDHQSYNSESPVMYDQYVFPEPTYDPYQAYFSSSPECHHVYNDMLMGIRDPPPKYGYKYTMPSSHIECLDRSSRQTDEINKKRIMDKKRTQFYGKQVYAYGKDLKTLGKGLMKD
ncbi:hypothetical protein L1987_78448 [Smallanthus sonchifolius]|uniref:Uncharacterized protein n=1 Tax=Smallanthus sonchifolius TaxID=185202 RepID=A0ACB8ZCH7_9ASTR|nr:hypothetical protein L1987_78448 [Smallanthus sonchifolius]